MALAVPTHLEISAGIISGDVDGGAFWLSEFHSGISDYELEVSGEFGSQGKNYIFNGGVSYQQ